MSIWNSIELKDENGVSYGIKHVQNKMRVSAMPYLYDIAEGNVSGHTLWNKIGFNPTVTTNEEDVWSASTAYVFCVTAGRWEIVSSDNTQDIGTSIKNDTSTSGSLTTLIDAGANFTGATAVNRRLCYT